MSDELNGDRIIDALRALGVPAIVEPGTETLSPAQTAHLIGGLLMVVEVAALKAVRDGYPANVANGMSQGIIQGAGGDPLNTETMPAGASALWVGLLAERVDMMREQIANMTDPSSAHITEVVMRALGAGSLLMAATAGVMEDGGAHPEEVAEVWRLTRNELVEAKEAHYRLKKHLKENGVPL